MAEDRWREAPLVYQIPGMEQAQVRRGLVYRPDGDAALERNAPFDLLTHPHGRHAFDALDADARTHEILAHTIAFLPARLGA